MLSLAAHYFLKAKIPSGLPVDSVARFHLRNGARLERINFMADLSSRGLEQAHGLMAKKAFGQHFLLDLNITRKIARLAAVGPGDRVIEVGPGPGGLTRGPSREDAANRLFADLDPAMKEWALARYTQHPAGIYTEGVKLDKFWEMSWEASVVWCKRAQNPGEAHQRRTAEKLQAPFFELDTGHYPMLSMPAELTALIMRG